MAGLFNKGRQAPQTQQVRKTVASIPTAQSVTPAQQSGVGGNARALAEALGSLNSSLSHYLNVQDTIQSDPNSLENREWVAKAQQMTPEELQALAESGTHEGIRVREDALWGLMGEKASADFRREWSEYYNTDFDRASGNAEEEMEAKRQEYAENLPSDFARAAFYQNTDSFVNGWLEKDLEHKTEYAKSQINQAVLDSFDVTLADAKDRGLTPEQSAALVFERSASNRAFLGMSGQEQNATIFQAAERAALAGDYETAKALLSGTRKGADGSTVPPLDSIPEYAAKSHQLLQTARTSRSREAQEEGFDVFNMTQESVRTGTFTEADAAGLRGKGFYTDEQLAGMVQQSKGTRDRVRAQEAKEASEWEADAGLERRKGQVYAAASDQLGTLAGVTNIRDVEIPNKDGSGTIKITKEEQIDTAIQRQESAWRDQQEALVQGGMSPEDASRVIDGQRVAWYSGNRLENEEWSNLFSGIPMMASTEMLVQGGAGAQQLARTAELYRTVKAQNVAYARSLVDNEDAREFLDTYDRAVRVDRLPPEVALQQAARWLETPKTQRAAMKPDLKITEKVTDRSLSEIGVVDNPVNRGIVATAVDNLGHRGLPQKALQKEVDRYLKESTVEINGVLVEDHRDLPRDFPILAERHLARLHKENKAKWDPDGGSSEDDLYLVPVAGESRWMVMSKDLGNIPTGHYVTPETMERERELVRTERQDLAAKKAAATAEKRQKAHEKTQEINAISEQFDRENQEAAEAARQQRAAEAQAELDAYTAQEQERVNRWLMKPGTMGETAAKDYQRELQEYLNSIQ